ncbi:hypothetical protein GCM10010315_55300 [Streptomyces luteosporeus]|uniref:Transposase n=1 Tax=Streptomyces luteosporeus TaxID=173856 RepID=A0ABN3U5M3_9ACTN
MRAAGVRQLASDKAQPGKETAEAQPGKDTVEAVQEAGKRVHIKLPSHSGDCRSEDDWGTFRGTAGQPSSPARARQNVPSHEGP